MTTPHSPLRATFFCGFLVVAALVACFVYFLEKTADSSVPKKYASIYASELKLLEGVLARRDPGNSRRWAAYKEVSRLPETMYLASIGNPKSGIGDTEILHANRVSYEYLVLWLADLDINACLQTSDAPNANSEAQSSPPNAEAACSKSHLASINARLESIPTMLRRLYVDAHEHIKSGDWEWYRNQIKLLAQREDNWKQVRRFTLERVPGLEIPGVDL